MENKITIEIKCDSEREAMIYLNAHTVAAALWEIVVNGPKKIRWMEQDSEDCAEDIFREYISNVMEQFDLLDSQLTL